jgi:hypothetical protein
MDRFKEPVPANAFIIAHPDQPGFTYNMVFRNKSPKTGYPVNDACYLPSSRNNPF